MRTRDLQRLIALLAAILISATAHAQNQGDSMNAIQAQKPTQTLCLGRFLVDIPREAYVLVNPSEYRSDKIDVTRRVSQEAFQQMILEREKMLKETRHETEPSLLKHISKSSDRNSVVLVFWKTPTSGVLFNTEAFKWMAGFQFLIKSYASPSKVAMAIEMANRSLSELQYRYDKDIPTTPGFCIDSGFFAGEPAWPHYEWAELGIEFKKHPDVWVSIYTRVNTKEEVDEGLLARVDRQPMPEIYKELAKQIKTLRRGKHPVGDIQAEELLETIPTNHPYSIHQLYWESPGKPQDIYAPTIVVEMRTGETIKRASMRPSLTDRQAMDLFDSIVDSIRVRPHSPSSSTKPDNPSPPPRPQPNAPLGATFPTGVRCPQSGIWQCAAANVFGSDTRYFPAGQTLPSVIVPIPRSLFQKLARAPSKRLADTTWTPIAYPDPTEKS